jgi:hypothetical protein
MNGVLEVPVDNTKEPKLTMHSTVSYVDIAACNSVFPCVTDPLSGLSQCHTNHFKQTCRTLSKNPVSSSCTGAMMIVMSYAASSLQWLLPVRPFLKPCVQETNTSITVTILNLKNEDDEHSLSYVTGEMRHYCIELRNC